MQDKQQDIINAIHECVRAGNIEAMENVFVDDPDCLNRLHTEHKTFPVDFAAQAGQLQALKWLVNSGAKLNTPLISKFAFQSGNIAVVNYIDEKDKAIFSHASALLAFCRGDTESINSFLAEGGNIFTCNAHGAMPLGLAIKFKLI